MSRGSKLFLSVLSPWLAPPEAHHSGVRITNRTQEPEHVTSPSTPAKPVREVWMYTCSVWKPKEESKIGPVQIPLVSSNPNPNPYYGTGFLNNFFASMSSVEPGFSSRDIIKLSGDSAAGAAEGVD